MIKYIIVSSLIYFIYRFFINPPKVESGSTNKKNNQENEEFTDYEEIE